MASAGSAIADEILRHDRRGVSALREHLPPDFVERAASLILETQGPVLIVTGFYVRGQGETDGPPGAVALGNALEQLGRPVIYVTDRYTAPFLEATKHPGAQVCSVEIADHEASALACQRILDEFRPGLLVAIERCGATQDGRYLNMLGNDISAYTAKLDYLFTKGIPSIGIGDGGNEIGMGNLAEVIRRTPNLVREPTVTTVDRLVIASVSNWGAYGLVAALSVLVGKDLLPSDEEAIAAIKTIVDLGAVDGFSSRPDYAAGGYRVDGFTLEENIAVLARLRDIVRAAVRSRQENIATA